MQINSEELDLKVNGYIIGNLLKHREISTFTDLVNCPFSSFRYFVEKYGLEQAKALVRSVIQINENDRGRIDLGELRKLKLPYPS